MKTAYRMSERNNSIVEEGQFRTSTYGMIKVLHPRHEIRDEKIHHASDESGVIFGIAIIFKKEKDRLELIDSVRERWEYHTAKSIVERWPTVLPNNWMELLISQQAFSL